MHAQNLSGNLVRSRERPALPDQGHDPIEVRFMVAGHALVAVSGADLPRAIGDSNRPARAVGRIDCSGSSYLIYEAQDAPIQVGAEAPPSATEILTKRELQIALLIAEGKCDKEIARTLGISNYTVREHVRRTFAKLNISRRSAIGSCVLSKAAPNQSRR